MPDDVYLTLEANAAVHASLSGARRVLIVGVPLLHILSERELRGVIAHEFGRYTGGDTRLGPWIYRTRETIMRSDAAAERCPRATNPGPSGSRPRLPFIWYGEPLLRITATIFRRQEFAADRFAPSPLPDGPRTSPRLERMHAYGPGLESLLGSRRGRSGALRREQAPPVVGRVPPLHRP